MATTNRRRFLDLAGIGAGVPALLGFGRVLAARNAPATPNIVFILADDIGYGDLGCYGGTGVRTSNVDRLAKEAMRFTDAHASASVCSPSRYSFLTGQYAWRNPAADHILSGEDPLTNDTAATTVPSLLRRAGYTTGLVGKWHMGLGKVDLDWNRDIRPGPLEVGFDYAFYYPTTNDRVPCVYIDGHRIVGLDPNDPIKVSYRAMIGNEPTGREHPEMLRLKLLEGHDGTIVDGISRIGFMSGGRAAWWKDEEIGDTLTRKAVAFMEQNHARPFFLYFATHNIHQPRWPNQRFRGTSACGTRCDAIQEFDAGVGAVLSAFDRLKLVENTLVIVSSDNGGAMDDGYESFDARDAHGHSCNGPFRGFKGSLWEGGHREPFIARWPGKIKPGSQSEEMLCLVDMLATYAAITGQSLPANAGPDSFNMLPALVGKKKNRPLRDYLVVQTNNSRALAIRKGPWKLIAATLAQAEEAPQLYNLAADPAETRNLAAQRADVVKDLSECLAHALAVGRTRGL